MSLSCGPKIGSELRGDSHLYVKFYPSTNSDKLSAVVKAKPVGPQTIPIVFAMGGDPIKLGVLASLARPGDTITGVSFLLRDLAAKEVELLHELVPKAAVLGLLANPKDPNYASDTKDAQAAALGHQLVVVNASSASEIEPAFAML